MNLSVREMLIRAKARGNIAINLDYEGLLKRLLGPSRDGIERGPTPIQRAYIESTDEFKALKGMAGVSKTSAGCASIILRALFQPNFQGFIGRYDYNKLMGTTAKRAEEMINRLNPDLIIDRDKTPPMKWYIQQPNGLGIAQIDFIGLKEYPGSYEWNRGFVDEADECELTTIEGLKTRLRAPCPPEFNGDYGLDMAFNPPDKTHWIYTACTGKDHQDRKIADATFKLFEAKYGENDKNLPPGYFDTNFKGLPPDQVDRLKWGKWGSNFPGEPVFHRAFFANVHVKPDIPFIDFAPLLVFLDFGFGHPAAIYAQMDDVGRLRLLAERLGENTEAKDWARTVKSDINTMFPRAQGVLYFGDPAAKQRKDTGSTLQVLGDEGIELLFLDGMSIEEGLRRIRYLLGDFVAGEFRLTVSAKGCPLTCSMFRGGYHKHKTTGKPVKDGFYDHLADALRYGVTNLYSADGRPEALPDPQFLQHLQAVRGEVPATLEYDGR